MSREYWWLPTNDGACSLWVQEFGVGSPVIWLHGGPCIDYSYLTSALEGISGRHIVYAQRGSLRAPAPIESITAQAHIDDLESLRVALGVERLTLVGHSWGTILALLYLSAYPTRVGPVVLTGTLPIQGPPEIDWKAAEAFTARPEIDAQIRAEGLGEAQHQPREQSLADRIREAGRKMYHIDRWREDWPLHWKQDAAEATVNTLAPYDFTDALTKHPHRITVLQGEYDYTDMGAMNARTQYGQIPGIDVHVIPKAGHDLWTDQPTMFREIVEKAIAVA